MEQSPKLPLKADAVAEEQSLNDGALEMVSGGSGIDQAGIQAAALAYVSGTKAKTVNFESLIDPLYFP
jgi:hypothetical protein